MGFGTTLDKANDSKIPPLDFVRDWPTIPIKGQVINILGFVCHMVSIQLLNSQLSDSIVVQKQPEIVSVNGGSVSRYSLFMDN